MRSLRLIATCVAAALAAVALNPGRALAAGPDPSSVYISSISYGGTGCPQGSVGSAFTDDRRHATLIFDAFVASSGPGVPVTEGRKNCQLNINVHAPRSVAWAANLRLDHRGYVQAPAGVTATQSDTAYSSQILVGTPHATTFTGPVARDYLSTDSYVLSSLDTLLCKGELVFPTNINSQVRLVGPASASAQITQDSIDIALEPQFVVPCAH
jgi:hypothetical protein